MVLSIGGLIFYYSLYQTKLVPRWLAGWGLIGTAVAIVASFLFMFSSYRSTDIGLYGFSACPARDSFCRLAAR